MAKPKPFHETVVNKIRSIPIFYDLGEGEYHAARAQLEGYAKLITATSIPANHDSMAIALKRKACKLSLWGGTKSPIYAAYKHIKREKHRHAQRGA